MNHAMQGSAKLEWLLAGTLRYGTSLASAVISLGLGLALIDSRFSAPSLAILRDMRIVTIGIAMLILLPVARVIVMLIVYFRQRDYRLAAIALLVLTIILLGFTVGLAESRHRDAPTFVRVPQCHCRDAESGPLPREVFCILSLTRASNIRRVDRGL